MTMARYPDQAYASYAHAEIAKLMSERYANAGLGSCVDDLRFLARAHSLLDLRSRAAKLRCELHEPKSTKTRWNCF